MRKRTTIDTDFQGFATALDRKPLAEIAEGVRKLCEYYGCEAAAQRCGKPKGWISKMRRIDKAVAEKSVVGMLVVREDIRDIEIAYYASLIENKSHTKALEIAENIDNETRLTVKQAWNEIR